MPYEDVTRRLTEFIMDEVASRPPEAAPAADFPIIEAGLLDSLGLFKLIAFIEEQYSVSIAPDDIQFENFATIGAITALVEGKLGAS